MSHQPLIQNRSILPVMIAAVFSVAISLSPAAESDGKKLRIICATSLELEHEVVLASRTKGAEWRGHGKVKLRESLISDWLPAKEGELHLAVRKGGKLESICQFTYPADTSRGLVILEADKDAKTYKAHFVDPEKAGFVLGSMLILNLSKLDGSVSHGSEEVKVPAGKRALVKPSRDDNGMFRMQVSYMDEKGEPQSSYDRYVSGNPNSRAMLLLLPNEATGLRVKSLSMIGDLE